MDAGKAMWVVGFATLWIGFGMGALAVLWVTLSAQIALMLDLEAQNDREDLRAAGWPEERLADGLFALPFAPTALKRLRRSYAWGRLARRITLWSTPDWLALSQTGQRARARFRRAQVFAILLFLLPVLCLAVVIPGFWAVLILFAAVHVAMMLWFRASPWPKMQEAPR